MNSHKVIAEHELPGLVDGLVCGELDEAARGRVLTWLEEDPVRWRLCGLAFLEAQTWSQTLGQCRGAELGPVGWAVPTASLPIVVGTAHPTSSVHPGKAGRGTTRRRALAATALLIAFGLGLTLQAVVISRKSPAGAGGDNGATAAHDPPATGEKATGEKPEAADDGPVLAALDVRTGDGFGPTSPIHIPVVPVSAVTGQGQDPRHGTEIPEYVRQQWERRGYKVSLERRYLFARLPDGQQVAVPIEQVHVNPIPVSIN